MDYILKPSFLFLKQVKVLSKKTKLILKEKLLLAKQNPIRSKRIKGYDLFLFRIRFKDKNKELRVIYLLDKNEIKILCILDRSKNYSELKNYLKQLNL